MPEFNRIAIFFVLVAWAGVAYLIYIDETTFLSVIINLSLSLLFVVVMGVLWMIFEHFHLFQDKPGEKSSSDIKWKNCLIPGTDKEI